LLVLFYFDIVTGTFLIFHFEQESDDDDVVAVDGSEDREEAEMLPPPAKKWRAFLVMTSIASYRPPSTIDLARLEVKKYCAIASISLSCSPLDWWRVNAPKFPLLANYARFALGIPATSVSSERVFSTAGDVVRAKRSNLSSSNADKLIFLHHNV
jgi:hypothetical protein